jgi:hypothetical protein
MVGTSLFGELIYFVPILLMYIVRCNYVSICDNRDNLIVC